MPKILGLFSVEGQNENAEMELLEKSNFIGDFLHSVEKLFQLDASKKIEKYWQNQNGKISALNLNLTDKCNLACIYCYAKGGNYDRINKELSAEDALKAFNSAIDCRDESRDFRVEFFGGEPLLNFEAIKQVIEKQKQLATHLNEKEIINRISTNLTEINPEIIDLFSKSKMIISVSFDGTAEFQNRQRPFKDGSGSHEKIFSNLKLLREKCPDNIIVARITVLHQEDKLYEVIEQISQTEIFDYVSLYPAALSAQHSTEIENKPQGNFSETLNNEFLKISQNYKKLLSGKRFKGILELNRFCQNILTGTAAANHCRAGAGYFTFSPDESIHPCHRLVGDPNWDLKAFSTLAGQSRNRLRDWRLPVNARAGCRECLIRFFCGGGCKQEAFITSGSLLGHSTQICSFSRLLFKSAIRICLQLDEVVEKKLVEFFRMSEKLFVFCGQPLIKLERKEEFENPISIRFEDQVFYLKPVKIDFSND
ncbi:MAG: radical SAM protein [Candidatus Riflebacteria bacterium]|nr:radical SAM protein [Candidatus Riflebacteria bacterium]